MESQLPNYMPIFRAGWWAFDWSFPLGDRCRARADSEVQVESIVLSQALSAALQSIIATVDRPHINTNGNNTSGTWLLLSETCSETASYSQCLFKDIWSHNGCQSLNYYKYLISFVGYKVEFLPSWPKASTSYIRNKIMRWLNAKNEARLGICDITGEVVGVIITPYTCPIWEKTTSRRGDGELIILTSTYIYDGLIIVSVAKLFPNSRTIPPSHSDMPRLSDK